MCINFEQQHTLLYISRANNNRNMKSPNMNPNDSNYLFKVNTLLYLNNHFQQTSRILFRKIDNKSKKDSQKFGCMQYFV